MGNSQSQESEPATPPTEAGPEDQEFDLSKIPDDRESAEREAESSADTNSSSEANPAKSSNEPADMARRTDKPKPKPKPKTPRSTLPPKQTVNEQLKGRRHERRRRSSNNTSNDSASDMLTRRSPPTNKSPDTTSQEIRPLKDTEPETYHIYATSDQSDAEGGDDATQFGLTNGFIAVNGSSPRITTREPVANANIPEEETTSPAQTQSPEPEAAVETFDLPMTIAATESANGRTAAQASTKIPAAKVNSEGRFLCPFAEVHNCEMTFASRKSAVRHAPVHTTSFICVVCKKKMSRNDTLKKHMKLHSALEIANAEAATNANGEANQEQVEGEHHPLGTPGAVEVDAEEPQEEGSTEFATPQDASQFQGVIQQNGVEKVLQDGQEVVESEMNEAEPVEGTAEGASEKESTSPPSIFDEEDTIVKETPVNLKRKRGAAASPEPLQQSPEKTRKRRKRTSNSPSTSVPSNELANPKSLKVPVAVEAPRSRQITNKIIPRLQPRQGSMDGWAQKFTPGANLKHPTLNPTPPRPAPQHIEVVIPHTSQAGPSGTKSKRKNTTTVDGAMDIDHEEVEADPFTDVRRKKVQKATYATPKGKKRAEPEVEYSTPTKDIAFNGASPSDADETSPVDLATSVAKRTFPRQNREVQTQDDDDDSDFDADQAAGSEPEGIQTLKLAKKVKKAKGAQGTAEATNGDRVECVRCHRTFASRELLNNHLKRPSAHIGLFKCLGCSEEFYATAALARHENDTGHGKGNGLQGRIGAFSQKEVDRLNNWRDQFCEYHNISKIEFNDMMTDTIERSKASSWSWPFVGRAEFLKEYLNVLPNRNKRSMLRYRERKFQNVEGSKNWTAEDDKELIRLQKQLGPKWAEIARRLTRTADAVSQRWRHKLQYKDVETGEWSSAENTKFGKILDDLRRDMDGNELEEFQIPWNKVSEKMGSRSAQQCSNHYRALHSKKSRGIWVKVDALEKTPGSSRILTPSKMDLRLSGKQVSRSSRKSLSKEYIDEDDDEGDAEAEESGDEEEQNEQGVNSQDSASEAESENQNEEASPALSEDNDSSARAIRNQNPVTTKTPGKTLRSSQLFAQTQANTSALKPSQQSSRETKGQASQDRPSPNIPIQRQPLASRSPLKEIRVLESGELDRDGDEVEEEAERSERSPESGTIEETTDDENEDEEEEEASLDDSADKDGAVKTESDEDESADADESGNDEVVKTESDEDEVAHDDDEDTDADATDDEETRSADEDEGDTAAERPTSSFMDSINESAKRANIKKVRSGSQTQTQTQTLMGLPIPAGRGRRSGHNQQRVRQQESDEEELE